MLNVTHVGTFLTCVPGFDGGDHISFAVSKSTSRTEPEEVDSTTTWSSDGSFAFVSIEDLWPLTNYTMRVFQENKYGRSAVSYSVTVRTLGNNSTVIIISD